MARRAPRRTAGGGQLVRRHREPEQNRRKGWRKSARAFARLSQFAPRAVPGPGSAPGPRCERAGRDEQQRPNGDRAPFPGGPDRSPNGRSARWRRLLGRAARQGRARDCRSDPRGGRAVPRGVRREAQPACSRRLIAALLAVVGLLAYVLGLVIARPLGRLTTAAAKVAAGDLLVELPGGGVGEVGYLTRVFNTLVARLRERESQAELERLSVTDALTGLYNRRHLMGTLATEVQRSQRLRRPFSVLMADVDHFKQYNDTQGHPAGDAALARIADILRKTTRGVDCVARYGGEEFVVMLLETTAGAASIVAERIRARVASEDFAGTRITISIGVAECPTHAETPESLIESADAALYEAKDSGRDRVVTADAQQGRDKEKKRRRARTARLGGT